MLWRSRASEAGSTVPSRVVSREGLFSASEPPRPRSARIGTSRWHAREERQGVTVHAPALEDGEPPCDAPPRLGCGPDKLGNPWGEEAPGAIGIPGLPDELQRELLHPDQEGTEALTQGGVVQPFSEVLQLCSEATSVLRLSFEQS